MSLERTTVVSCLYDLARRDGTGRRTPAEILAEAAPVLGTRHGLVVFCDPELEPVIRTARADASGGPSMVIARPFEDLHAVDRLATVRTDLSEGRRSPAAANDAKDTPRYFVLTWSKLALLSEVIDLDPFQSSRFWWADLGLAHVARPHPDRTFDDVLDAVHSPLHVSLLCDVTLGETKDRVGWYSTNTMPRVAGGLFGGDAEPLRQLAEWFELELGRCVAGGYPALEEVILGPVVAEHRGAFTCTRASHEEILERMLDER